jgi:hypothetical protein
MADVTPDDTQRDATTPGNAAAGAAQGETTPEAEATASSAVPTPTAAVPVTDAPAPATASTEATAALETGADAAAALSDAAEAAAAIPEVESTTTVAPLGGATSGSGEGGEWDLLVAKVKAWLESGQIQTLWRQSKSPLTLALAAIGVLLLLRVYAGLLAVIESLPLVPGLLELVGVIYAVRVGLPRLVQRSKREELIQGLQQRWNTFVGRS